MNDIATTQAAAIVAQALARLTAATQAQGVFSGGGGGSGTVTSITGGNGLTPGPITVSGTIGLVGLTSAWAAGNFNITSKNSVDVLNVRAFGAVGDGTTDDGPAIQLAWNAQMLLNVKPVLFFPSGQYNIITALTTPGTDTAGGHFTWQGVDDYSTRIKCSTSGPMMTYSGAQEFICRDLVVVYNSGTTPTAIALTGANTANHYFENMQILGAFGKGIVFGPGQLTYVRFYHCVFDSQVTSQVECIGSGGANPSVITFDKCRFINSTTNSIVYKGSGGLFAVSLTVRDCDLEGGGPILLDGVSHFIFKGNHCESQKVISMTTAVSGSNQFSIEDNQSSATALAHFPQYDFKSVTKGYFNNNRINLATGSYSSVNCVQFDSNCADFQERQTFQGGTGTLTGTGVLVANSQPERSTTRVATYRLVNSGSSADTEVAAAYQNHGYRIFPGTNSFPAGARYYLVASMAATAGTGDFHLVNQASSNEIGICSRTGGTTTVVGTLSTAATYLPADETTMLRIEMRCSGGGTLSVFDAYIRVEF